MAGNVVHREATEVVFLTEGWRRNLGHGLCEWNGRVSNQRLRVAPALFIELPFHLKTKPRSAQYRPEPYAVSTFGSHLLRWLRG
jgi:hypothetical protein